ncbi:MAG TPA: ABC transporter permease [Anaerolineales bacterium]|nr:ABC transporter permease [Anaerolineales bacterium]
MGKYIVRRILISIPVLLGITVIVFGLIQIAPGDPVAGMIDPTIGNFDADRIETEREKLGLNQPLVVQYFFWLGRVLKGDLGYSLITQKPVSDMIQLRLGPTLKLTISALILSSIVGISVGILSAVKQYSLIDYVSTFFSFVAVSLPGFFLALALIYLFALKLDWLPTSGMSSLGQEASLWDEIQHMILPVSILGIGSAAPLVRYARSSMLDILNQDYVMLARAKGVREWATIIRHAFPNALIPLITVIGLRLPVLFAGSVIVEQIFHWQGLGSLNIWAVLNQDYSVLMALNLISAVLVLGANLITDIAYAVVDPRIQLD